MELIQKFGFNPSGALLCQRIWLTAMIVARLRCSLNFNLSKLAPELPLQPIDIATHRIAPVRQCELWKIHTLVQLLGTV